MFQQDIDEHKTRILSQDSAEPSSADARASNSMASMISIIDGYDMSRSQLGTLIQYKCHIEI